MKQSPRLLLAVCILLSIIGNSSCSSTKSVADSITISSGEIPPDMKTEKFNIIGILKKRNSYDKYVKKNFGLYKGDYVLATMEEADAQYADVSKYRYLMDCTEQHSNSYNYATRTNESSTGYRYFILDRKTGKKYVRKSRSSFFALEIKAYVTAINSVTQNP